jgi:predicted nucleotidyltransferase
MPENIEIILDNVIARITRRFTPEKIILFGSYARGTTTRDSDIDLLIVMNVEGSLRGKTNEIDLLLADRTVPMDLLVVTPKQYERQKELIGTVVRQAVREGRVIYERAA